MGFRPGQWVKFDDPTVTVNGQTGDLSAIFPNVQKLSDGKIVGIYSQRRRDGDQIVPAQITPVQSGRGENLSVVNEKTSLPETMSFIERAAIAAVKQAREASESDPGPAPICLDWPAWEDLGAEAVLDKAHLPSERQTAEDVILEP